MTFNKIIRFKNSVDTGSLSVFADNCGNNFCNDPDIQDVSVSGKSVIFSINGNDTLTGGDGADYFNCGMGSDKVTDYNPSEGDSFIDCEIVTRI